MSDADNKPAPAAPAGELVALAATNAAYETAIDHGTRFGQLESQLADSARDAELLDCLRSLHRITNNNDFEYSSTSEYRRITALLSRYKDQDLGAASSPARLTAGLHQLESAEAESALRDAERLQEFQKSAETLAEAISQDFKATYGCFLQEVPSSDAIRLGNADVLAREILLCRDAAIAAALSKGGQA